MVTRDFQLFSDEFMPMRNVFRQLGYPVEVNATWFDRPRAFQNWGMGLLPSGGPIEEVSGMAALCLFRDRSYKVCWVGVGENM